MTTNQKIKKLPKGLLEFYGSLADPKYAKELLPRLLDLPESGFHERVKEHAIALKAIEEAEEKLAAAKLNAMRIADKVFRTAVDNWTVRELQKATGYDHD